MQRRTRDVLIRQRTQIINALRDASGRARVRGGAGQRRGQRIARARDGRSWKKPRRVVAKVEWHPGELYPRVGFIVTNLSRPAERVVASTTSAGRASNGSSKARERSSGRGCHAARSPPTLRPAGWSATTASCAMAATSSSRFAVPKELFHEIRRWRCQRRSSLQLQALAYNLANFMRTVVPRSAAESRRGGDCGLREKPDGHVFKGDRWEECVQMPGKMARSDPRPPSGLPVVAAVVRAANPPWQNTGYS